MTDGTGTTSYSYDSLGRVTSITDGAGVKVGYGYDLNGNLTSLTYPNGQTAAQNYSYTQLGQLASDNGASYGYDPAGDMTQVAGGTQQTFNAGSELQSATVPGTAKPAATDKVVSANVSGKTGKLTSPAVTTKEASDLVLAFVAANGPARTTQRVTKLAGGGLKWSLVVRSNARQGTAEVWQAHASSRLKKAKITATLRFKCFDGSITIAAFTGAGLTAGAHAAASGKTHAPAISLTTTARTPWCGQPERTRIVRRQGKSWRDSRSCISTSTPRARARPGCRHPDLHLRAVREHPQPHWYGRDRTAVRRPVHRRRERPAIPAGSLL